MIKNKLFLSIFIFLVTSMSALKAQTTASDLEMEEVLSSFKNYRFGSVYMYEMKDVSEISKYFKQKEEAANMGQGGDKKCYEDLPAEVKSVIDNNYEDGINAVVQQLNNQGIVPPSATALECAIEYKRASANQKQTYYQAYVVTTKPAIRGAKPSTYIGLLVFKKNSARPIELNTAMQRPYPKDMVFTRNEMKDTKLNINEYGASDFYELVDIKFKQGDMRNITLEAKDIGGIIKWAEKDYGVSEGFVSYDSRYKISDPVLQTYKRITEGNPNDIGTNTNELTISPDLIRWVSYEPQYIKTIDETTLLPDYEVDSLGNKIIDPYINNNDYLPKFGVELKYGVEGMPYTSFWSERMALNAIWKNVKLGLILPTNGWASLSNDVFSQQRRLTTSDGVGINGKIDFPIYLIKMSDVFDVSFSYVFGDAAPASYKTRNTDPLTFQFDPMNPDLDYMLRGNAQIHYTFAFKIDDDYLLRVGLGGTIYNMESWSYQKEQDALGVDVVRFNNITSETVGGLSGRIDLMVRDESTPYGVSAFYFDEMLGLAAWLQIPLIDNTLAMRLEANGYAVAFKNTPRAWENTSVITPMVRFLYNF